MYISCKSLWDSGITKDKVGCCGSCHYDEEEWPNDYPLIEIYPQDIGLPRGDSLVGSVCCAVWRFVGDMENGQELMLDLYRSEAGV